jgi:hypothetical protein
MARRKHSRRSTGFWKNGGNRLLLIALFGLWVWVALWLNWHVVLLATTAIVLIETI